jgi:hypothetical protein
MNGPEAARHWQVRPDRTRGQWGEPYGVTVHKKRGVPIHHSFIHALAGLLAISLDKVVVVPEFLTCWQVP